MHCCISRRSTGGEDFVDIKFAASTFPARAGTILLLIDDLGVEDPEGGCVGVQIRVGAWTLLAR